MKKYLTFIFIIFSSAIYAQTPKYNNIIDLIEQKNFTKAYTLLYDYQAKNPEFANTYFQLGNITYDMTFKSDPIKNLSESEYYIYNTKLYYGLCINKLQAQEKDVKHNEKYYKTDSELKKIDKLNNEIVINLLDKRLDKIKEYDKNIHSTVKNFNNFIDTYHKTTEIFIEIITQYPNLANLYLEEKSKLLKELNRLSLNYDSTIFYYNKYINGLNNYPILTYHQQISPQPIKTYRLQGISQPNFLADTITIWDYKSWAEALRTKLNGDISHFRQTISKANKELANKEREIKNYQGFSNSLKPFNIEQKIIFEIEKFDYNSLITSLLQYRTEKIRLLVKSKRKFNDTTTFLPLIQTRSKELFDLISIKLKADSLINIAENKTTKDNYQKHKDFLDFNYNGYDGLKNYFKSQKIEINQITQEAIKNNLYITYRDVFGLTAKQKTIKYQDKILKNYVEKIAPEAAQTNQFYTLDIALTKDGSKYITGYYKTSMGSMGFVAKITNNQVAWFKNTSNSPRVTQYGIKITGNTKGCYVIIRTIINDKPINTLLQFDSEGNQKLNIKLSPQQIPRNLYIDDINQTAIITFQGKNVDKYNDTDKKLSIQKIDLSKKSEIWTKNFTLEGNIINIIKFDTTYHIFANYKNATISQTAFLNDGYNILHIRISDNGDQIETDEIKSEFFCYGLNIYKINSNTLELIGLTQKVDIYKTKFNKLPKPYIIFITKNNKTIYQNHQKTE